MVDYASRIASLKSEQTKLAQRQTELATQRREAIGRLAERLGVLEADDEVLAGLLIELKAGIESGSPRVAQWRVAGARFRSGKLKRQPRGTEAAPRPNGADEAARA
jgi:hypothetical protein